MKSEIPSLTLSTDVIVGFPSETEEEYLETLSMMEKMSCTEAFMYYFNPREGTRAEKMEGQIEEKIKIQRLERLINEQIERQKRIKTDSLPFETIGIVTSVTRDDSSRYLLRTEHNEYVSFLPLSNHKNGDVVYVRATELNGNTFRGEEIEKE